MLLKMGQKATKPMMAEKPYVPKAAGGFAETGNAAVEVGTVQVASILVKTASDALRLRLGGQKELVAPADKNRQEEKVVRFVAETALNAEDSIGAHLRTVQKQLCIVTAVGASGLEFEAEFLDGHREKLSLGDVRHAGNLESAEFYKLANTPFAVGQKRQRELQSGDASDVGEGRVAPTGAWNIMIDTVMRIVTGGSAEVAPYIGRKCRIESINKKAGTARVLLLTDDKAAPASSAAAPPVFLTVQRGELETVVPHKKKTGVILSGPYVGKHFLVEERKKDSNDELTHVRGRIIDAQGVPDKDRSLDIPVSNITALDQK